MAKPVQIINNYWLKETILNGNPDLDKFYKEDLIKMVNVLKTENKKYKKVIDKAIEYIEQHAILVTDGTITTNKHEILEILKEVEHE